MNHHREIRLWIVILITTTVATKTLALGESCEQDSDCYTNRCFQGKCVCRTNNDCSFWDDVCSEIDVPSGGSPRCALALGKECSLHGDCTSRVCYKGVCQCNPKAEFGGCPLDRFMCVGDASTGYECVLKTNATVGQLPFGSECYGDCECATGFCYTFSRSSSLSPGTCRCNPTSNTGCPEGYQCSDIIEHDVYIDPECRLAFGSNCSDSSNPFSDIDSCPTGNCFEGFCYCLPENFYSGCSENEYCLKDPEASDVTFRGKNLCVPRRPVGAQCASSDDCQTSKCIDGICECLDYTTASESGCPQGQSCLSASGEMWTVGPWTCATRNAVDVVCEENTDCESANCLDGFCTCQPDTGLGCPEDSYCIQTEEGSFSCEKKNPTGSSCMSYIYYSNLMCESGLCADDVCREANFSFSSCVEYKSRDELPTTPPSFVPTEAPLEKADAATMSQLPTNIGSSKAPSGFKENETKRTESPVTIPSSARIGSSPGALLVACFLCLQAVF